MLRLRLQESVTKTADSTGAEWVSRHLRKMKELIITLDATALDRANGDETYDLHITTGDGVSEWDLVHFPQIATAGAKRFTAKVVSDLQPQNVSTAAPGVAAVDSATLATIAGGADAIKSLAAGSVRHGPFGDRIKSYLVVGGTTPSITYSILVEGRR